MIAQEFLEILPLHYICDLNLNYIILLPVSKEVALLMFIAVIILTVTDFLSVYQFLKNISKKILKLVSNTDVKFEYSKTC